MSEMEEKPEVEEVAEPEAPKAEWSYRERFPIQDKMAGLIREAIKVSEAELDMYRRKLKKMQFGG